MGPNAEQRAGKSEIHIDPDRLAQRLNAIDQWIEHVRSTPAPQWGAELNELINLQISSAEALSGTREEGSPQFDQFDPDAIRAAGRTTG